MKYLIFLTIFFLPIVSRGQESKLAQQYFQNGEYEKAAALYQKLAVKNNNNDFYFTRYIDCLISLEQYEKGEQTIKKQLKKFPKKTQLYVTYGNIFERQYLYDEAKEQYEKAIKKLPPDRGAVTKLANAFTSLTKYDLAILAYEQGAEVLKNDMIFSYNLGDLYRRKGDTPKMITNYLNSLEESPSRLNSLKTLFQRYLLSEDDYAELQAQLYERIQEAGDDAVYYPELLTWVFIQNKDYQNAFRQVKALDRKLEENGGRVFRLAQIAANAQAYDAAIEAFDYVVVDKGTTSTYYIEAKRESLTCKRKKLVQGFDYTHDDLTLLETQYEAFLAEFGSNKSTATIIAELADLEAFYLNDLDKAINLLKEMIDYIGLNPVVKAKGKLSLADFYLMKGEIWEATLLYSQVDKDFKDDILGHEARYRNAKLSYFASDFQWAQTQFDILKASTSKLIANDALDLSIFIMDNLGLDTSAAALTMYSEADMLTFQNKLDEAMEKLESMQDKFPEHDLKDDILYSKAQIHKKRRNYTEAANLLQKIYEEHKEEIRADNALFELAELYELQLGDPDKAKELHEKMFMEFSGSTFAVESRKRYRKLRGDDVQ